jgi:hypothetical protein
MIEEEAIEKIIGLLRSLQDDHTYMLRGQAPVANKLSFHCQILTKRTKGTGSQFRTQFVTSQDFSHTCNLKTFNLLDSRYPSFAHN